MRSLHPDDPEYLGGFRLVARLGSNTAGTVHLGVDGDGHPAAVTAVRPECVTDPGFTARLAHETETAPRVQSRFVPQPLGYDLTTPEPWSAVEYVVGPSLRDLVASVGPLPAAPLVFIARGLAEVLARMHQEGITHASVRPEHVLVDSTGPHLLGLGTARSAAFGEKPDPAGDVYDLGRVLAMAADAEKEDLSAVPMRVRPLIIACLSEVPEDRPEASDVLVALGGPLPDLRPEEPWLPPHVLTAVTDTERRFHEVIGPITGTVPPLAGPVERPVPSTRADTHPDKGHSLLVRVASLGSVTVLLAGLGMYVVTERPWEQFGPVQEDVRECSGEISEELAPEEPPATRFSADEPLELAFSPDGSVLAVSQGEGVTLWDWQGSEPLAEIVDDTAMVSPTPGSFSPDGCLLARGTTEGAIVVELDTGNTFPVGPEQAVRDVAFSPDGSQLAIAPQSDPGKRHLHLWDTDDWQLRTRFPGSAPLEELRFSLDGSVVAGGEVEGGVAVWNLAPVGPAGLIQDRSGAETGAFDVVPDGSGVLVIRSDRVLLFRPGTQEVVREFVPHTEAGVLVDVGHSAASGRVFATRIDPNTTEGDLVMWEFTTGKEVRPGEGMPRLFPIALSPDGSRLAGLQARTGRIAVYDTELVPLSVLGD